MKLELDEFIEEIKAEIAGYEEIDEKLIIEWEKNFREVIKTYKDPKGRVKREKNSIYIVLEDESEIFRVADQYFSAVDGDEIKEYWAGFQL
ncbi:hypothetical protein EDC18_106130 [Natranaerovirga pectinivora]|uniref:Uncharacterized protein n=1 Tax=Natranaerovirga pectinivora TaxID=682400 RepID=A0A4R3MLA1_9FIRM|nr:hypothetical protein [Natranaerovirga pectinivora]TCT14332.1 hypothetical protein EDC18_106130 [Natranaerovirga pectinivora]